jgi:fatty acid desaturase
VQSPPNVSDTGLAANHVRWTKGSAVVDEQPRPSLPPLTQIDICEFLGIQNDELRTLLHGLSGRKMSIYWIDFVSSATIACATFVLFPLQNIWSGRALICFLIATLSLYRAALFTHEIAHMPKRTAHAFSIVWNLFCGIPLFIPSFMYEIHMEHHAPATYGSARDGEYLKAGPVPQASPFRLILASFVGAPALALRFLLAPVGWLTSRFRYLLLSRASALVIDAEYRRRVIEGEVPVRWTIQEAACFGWSALLLLLATTGVLPITRLVEAYAVMTAVLLVNSVRVAVAHRYAGSGDAMSLTEQVLDSNTFPGVIAAFWAPLGLRFHALHHLLPGLPYHSLPETHRRIMSLAATNSLYRRTVRPSLVSVLRDIFVGPGVTRHGLHL